MNTYWVNLEIKIQATDTTNANRRADALVDEILLIDYVVDAHPVDNLEEGTAQ